MNNLDNFDIEDFKEYVAMKNIIAQSNIDYKPIKQWTYNHLQTQAPPPKAKCTKFCSKIVSGSKCNKGKSCTFAHRIEDWSPITCNFGAMCNRKTTNCSYIHPDESKEKFASRVNQALPAPKSAEEEEDEDDEEEEEEIRVIIEKPYVRVPKECEDIIKETLKNRGITDYTICLF
jgi:hypothetical protein